LCPGWSPTFRSHDAQPCARTWGLQRLDWCVRRSCRRLTVPPGLDRRISGLSEFRRQASRKRSRNGAWPPTPANSRTGTSALISFISARTADSSIGQVVFHENAVYLQSCQEAQSLLASSRWRDLVVSSFQHVFQRTHVSGRFSTQRTLTLLILVGSFALEICAPVSTPSKSWPRILTLWRGECPQLLARVLAEVLQRVDVRPALHQFMQLVDCLVRRKIDVHHFAHDLLSRSNSSR
jgi:hypothetical protein